MKRLLLIPLLFLFFGFVSDKKNIKQKSLCGPLVDFSNINTYDSNCLIKVKFTEVSSGTVSIKGVSLWGHDQQQNVQHYMPLGGFYFNIVVLYWTNSTTNHGYVYIADSNNNIIECQAVTGTESTAYYFYNIFLPCAATYHIGIRDTPC